MIAWAAIMGSRTVRMLGLSIAALGAIAVAFSAIIWNAERRGAERALVKVERKANEDTALANEVRNETPSIKRGTPDPFLRK